MINRSLLRILRTEIDNALTDLGKKFNVKFSTGQASFTENNATFKLEVASIDKDGTVKTKTASDFELYASSFGLQPDDLGKKFKYAGSQYEIVGIKPRSYKFPILVNKNGKTFKMPAEQVKFYLEMANK